jgi:integrase
METHTLRLVNGTAAFSASSLLDAELAKDRWDARNIPGLAYQPHGNSPYVNFFCVPEAFRPVVKDYVTSQLASGRVAKTLNWSAYCLADFFTFFTQRYPQTCHLHALCEQDIDAFVTHLKATAVARQLKDTYQYICHRVCVLEAFLNYLERVQHSLKPVEPTTRLIWPHHYPKRETKETTSVKYIPQSILRQLESHLQRLPPACIPIVILLRASGWRISDVLYLKSDTCLQQDGDKYYLVGDIQKTRVLGHKVPITKEVAAVVFAQIQWVKQHYTIEENPKGWLFPASTRQKKSQRFLQGDPVGARGVSSALNKLAEKYQIRDDRGAIFHFRLHAFRHTKGVELVNNGMSLVLVQQWMAHASPEMTLIYAKILDETMHTQWEKAVQQGIVQFNEGKPEYVSGKKMLTVINEAQGFDPARVRDYRANTKLPVGNCVKSPKLLCKFTELPCFHCPAYVLTPEDLPALEIYEQQLLERVEIGKQANNAYWIEINQKNLEERVRPAMELLKQGQIVAKSAKHEREYTPEEWEQHQSHVQEKREP